jgi:ABC-type transport system substrate-binding protein
LHTTVSYRSLIEYVQGQLDRVGIKTSVEINQGASLRELVSKNGVNFFYGSWIADYPDAENYLSVFYSKNKIPWGQIIPVSTANNSMPCSSKPTTNPTTKNAMPYTGKWITS